MEPFIFSSSADLGEKVAAEIVEGIVEARLSGANYLLGCPAGRTARSTYQALARRISREKIPVDHLFIVMMDAYVAARGDGFEFLGKGEHCSCQRFAHEEIVSPINDSTPAGKGITTDRVWLPDPNNPMEFDERIASAGGVNLFILASGSTDGHVGFNPPGTERGSKTRVVKLAESTRRDNTKTYRKFASVEDVPEFGVTVGISTIADNSHNAIMLLLGAEKSTAFRRISSCKAYDPSWPASVVWECRQASTYADREAAVSSPDARGSND